MTTNPALEALTTLEALAFNNTLDAIQMKTDAYAIIRSALSTPDAGWQPIETAPRNGPFVGWLNGEPGPGNWGSGPVLAAFSPKLNSFGWNSEPFSGRLILWLPAPPQGTTT